MSDRPTPLFGALTPEEERVMTLYTRYMDRRVRRDRAVQRAYSKKYVQSLTRLLALSQARYEAARDALMQEGGE